jgi:hypothetical protein
VGQALHVRLGTHQVDKNGGGLVSADGAEIDFTDLGSRFEMPGHDIVRNVRTDHVEVARQIRKARGFRDDNPE